MNKKDFIKTLAFFIPFILYAALFVAYEPNNYWGIRDDNGDLTSAITLIRRTVNMECENIILGGSRVALLDPDDLEEIGMTDEHWTNLSMNGATISEIYDLFWRAVEKGNLQKVLFIDTFYGQHFLTMYNRVQEAATLSEDIFVYISSPSIHRSTIKTICTKIFYLPISLFTAKSDDPENISLTNKEKREKIYARYVQTIWEPAMENFQYDENALDKTREIIEYCNANNIEIRIVVPPMRKEVYECIERNGISDEERSFYKIFLSEFTTVYDMEYSESKWIEDLTFADGVHFNGLENILEEDFTKRYPMLVDVFNVMFHGKGEEVNILSKALSTTPVLLDEDIFMAGDNELHVYSEFFDLEPDSMYILFCKGSLEKDAEYLYMDFYNLDENATREAFVPKEIRGEDDAYWEVIQIKENLPEDTFSFRIVYQGNDDLCIDQIEIRQVK